MDYKILHEALSRRRAHETETDAEFAGVLIQHLATFNLVPYRVDAAGNIYYQVGESRTLFAAHIDTAHHMGGVNTYKLYKSEKVRFKKNTPTAWAQAAFVKADGAALGADDGAGVMLLCWLMQNYVPGHYVFTRGEECGGIGATFIADNYSDWLRQFDRAICFDRAGYDEVITHQGGQRCASDAFGEALSEALNEQGLLYMPSDKGIYTDCKEWIDVVSEAVNVSVGYFSQHGPNEWLNLEHLRTLAAAVINIEWENLPTVRDPDAVQGFGLLSAAREQALWTKVLKHSDLNDVLEMALDGDDTLLQDMIASEFSLTIAEQMQLDCSGLTSGQLTAAQNMDPKAALKYLYSITILQTTH
jgi:hypothetical protein